MHRCHVKSLSFLWWLSLLFLLCKAGFEGSGTNLLARKLAFKLKHSKNHMVEYGTMANQSLITLILWSRPLLLI